MDETHAIFELAIPENWIGKTVGEIDIRRSPIMVLGNIKDIQGCFHI